MRYLQYIDPDIDSWGLETKQIWSWMKADWEANNYIMYVADTLANRIKSSRVPTIKRKSTHLITDYP